MKRRTRKTIYLYCIAFVAGCLLVFAAVFIRVFADKQAQPDIIDPLVIAKCTQCHGIERITQYRLTKQRWDVIAERMCTKTKAVISKQESEQIVEFLKEHYPLEIKALFKEKCIDCHKYLKNEELLHTKKTSDGWGRAIERMREKYSFLIGKEEAEMLKSFWGDPENNVNIIEANAQTRSLAVFEDKCMRCHTHSFLFGMKKNKEDWMTLLKQKQKKYKHWISIKDKEMIEEYLINDK